MEQMEFFKKYNHIKSVNLTDFGVNNIAFGVNEIKEVISILKNLNIAIKGGDVWIKQNGNLNLTYDNWYCEQMENETYPEYVEKSIKQTEIYIDNYPLDNDIYFELVI